MIQSDSRQRFRAIATALVVVLMLPASAAAKPDYKVRPSGVKLLLPVVKRGDRIISVSANNRQRVHLKVESPSSKVEYSVMGRVSSQRIAATFGTLGHIDVRLEFARFDSTPFSSRPCKGPGPRYGAGTFRGTIELADQKGGFVPNLLKRRGHVHFKRSFRQVCKPLRHRYKPGPHWRLKRKLEEGVLTVRGKRDGRTVRLDATIFALKRNPARSGGLLGATAYERHQGVRITRWTAALFDRDSFVMSRRGQQPETLEVSLADPFAGHALYSNSPGISPTWTGDLTANLPGADNVPLTGPGFVTTLCRGSVDSCLYRRGLHADR